MDDKPAKNDSREPAKLRFGSRQLFYATALIAAGLALGPETLVLSAIVLIGWTIVFSLRGKRHSFALVLLILLFLFCLSGTLMPATGRVREAARRTQCMNNMRQILLAILNYESANGHFPTDRVVTAADGTELRHSWRILILPYVEEQKIFAAYDFSEPWNGPNNSKLAAQLTWSIFQCPSHDAAGVDTPYKLVVGEGTGFERGKEIGTNEIPDGMSNTIAIVEDSTNPVNWMEPSDLSVEQAVALLNGLDRKTCAHISESPFERRLVGSHLALFDGRVFCSHPNPMIPISAGAFLIDDGEFFDEAQNGRPLIEIKYGGYVALMAYLFLIILPAFYLKK